MEQRTDRTGQGGRRHLLGVVLALAVLALVSYLVLAFAGIRQIQSLRLDDDISVDVTHADGRVDPYPGSRQFPAPERGATIHVTVHLPMAERMSQAALCFYNYNSVVTVRYQDQVLYERGGEEREAGRTTGHTVVRVPIPEEAWGQDLTIDLFQLEDQTTSNIHGVFAMPALQAWLYPLLLSSQAEFVASFTFSVAAIIMLLVFTGMYLTGNSTRQGIYLALFCLTLSIWDLSYTSLVYLVTDDATVTPTLEYVSLHLVPTFLYGYLRFECRDRRWARACLVLEVASAGVALLAVVTELLGIRGLGYLGLLGVSQLGLGVMAAMSFAVGLSGGMRRDPSRQVLRWGMGATLVLTLLEVVRVVLNRASLALSPGLLTSFVESTLAPAIIITFETTLVASYLIRLVRSLRARTERLQLERLAYTDTLTGIPNRTSLDRHLDQLRSAPPDSYTLLFLDVNRLKAVNDGLGHEAGDRMIELVGRALRESMAGVEGFYGRYGGDEFVACLYQPRDVGGTIRTFEGIIASANDRGYLPVKVDVSFGRADHEGPGGPTVDEELRRADAQMYQDKARREGTSMR